MSSLLYLVPLLLLTVFVQNGEPVRCWACSSDVNSYCNDPYIFTDGSLKNRLEDCDINSNSWPNRASKSVCKKQKQYVKNQLVTIRGCTWKRLDDYTNSCLSSTNGAQEVTTFCETCDRDGCNGASAVGKTLALLIAPLGLLLFK